MQSLVLADWHPPLSGKKGSQAELANEFFSIIYSFSMMNSMANRRLHLIEKAQLFSQSLIWCLQRQFFKEQSVAAWSNQQVPYFPSNSPYLAKFYADLVFSWAQDNTQSSTQPLYLVELGAGAGKLAFHFLKYFEETKHLHDNPPEICYIITDFIHENLEFSKKHPKMQAFISKGLLDFAHFDANETQTLTLKNRNLTIKKNSLEQPLIIIANYFFDSIPQELFFLDQGTIYQVLLSIYSPEPIITYQELPHLRFNYHHKKVEKPFKKAEYNRILSHYLNKAHQTCLLFPEMALNTLNHLKTFSQRGFILLTSDGGETDYLSLIKQSDYPQLSHHGGFFLLVNFHAIIEYFKAQGAQALVPSKQNKYINTIALLTLKNHDSIANIQNQYHQLMDTLSPDDWTTLIKQKKMSDMKPDLQELFDFLELSSYDASTFIPMVPHLIEGLKHSDNKQKKKLIRALECIWSNHYKIESPDRLPYFIGLIYTHLAQEKKANDYMNLAFREGYFPIDSKQS